MLNKKANWQSQGKRKRSMTRQNCETGKHRVLQSFDHSITQVIDGDLLNVYVGDNEDDHYLKSARLRHV